MTSHAFNQLGLPEPPPREQERPCTPGANAPKAAPPPYQSLITAGWQGEQAASKEGKATSAQPPREPREAALTGSLWCQLALPPPSPWEAPVEVASPAGTALSFGKVTWSRAQEALPVAGSCWATPEAGALKRSFCLAGTTVFISSP